MTEHFLENGRAKEIEQHVDELSTDEKRVYMDKIVRDFDDDNNLVLDGTNYNLDTI